MRWEAGGRGHIRWALHAPEERDFLTEHVTEQVRWAHEATVAPEGYEMDWKGRNEGRETGGAVVCVQVREREGLREAVP